MMGILRYIMSGLIMCSALAGCSRQPLTEIQAARTAIDAAFSDGAEKFSPADTKKLEKSFAAAMDEVKAQDGRFFSDYTKATQMLLRVKADAEELKAALPTRKEEAGKIAVAGFEKARAAVSDVKRLFAKAPKVMERSDPEDMEREINGFDDLLAEIQKLINSGDYTVASEKALVLTSRVRDVAAHLRTEVHRGTPQKETRTAGIKK